MAPFGYDQTVYPLLNKPKKLKKDYRDQKRSWNTVAVVNQEKNQHFDLLDVLGDRPANQTTAILNNHSLSMVCDSVVLTTLILACLTSILSLATAMLTILKQTCCMICFLVNVSYFAYIVYPVTCEL